MTKKREQIGGPAKPGDLFPGEVFAQRLKEVRERRGWTQTRLVRRLEELGFSTSSGKALHRSTLAKIEADPTRARRVTLEEVLAISYALGVSPLYMFIPIELGGPNVTVALGVQAWKPSDMRAWLRGEQALPYQDPRWFALERPEEEIPEALSRAPEVVTELQKTWRPVAAPTKTEEER